MTLTVQQMLAAVERHRKAGRGRQSHARGATPKQTTATLSQLPTRTRSQEARQ